MLHSGAQTNSLDASRLGPEKPKAAQVKRVFIDNSISGIFNNQKGINGRDSNTIGNLRLSLNDTANQRSSVTYVPQQSGANDATN